MMACRHVSWYGDRQCRVLLGHSHPPRLGLGRQLQQHHQRLSQQTHRPTQPMHTYHHHLRLLLPHLPQLLLPLPLPRAVLVVVLVLTLPLIRLVLSRLSPRLRQG